VTTPPTTASFDDALRAVRDVEGWMTDAQARRLWDRAIAVGANGHIVEIGSFRGRSAIVLAKAAAPAVEVVAIDPHGGNDRGPQEIKADAERGEGDHDQFHANLEAAGVDERIRHVRLASQDVGQEVADPIDMLYIDGAHRYGPARDDIRDWGERVAANGTMLIHDSFSSVGVTFAILSQLLTSKEFRYVGRSSSLAEYHREHVTSGARWKNIARQLGQLPWFIRNVIIKTLLVAHLKPLTRLFGHTTGDWPY
jgi:predicted O-methyltransferase YrrM